MDQLLVLHQGELVEHGTHEELLQGNSHYVNMMKGIERKDKQ